MTVTNDSPKTDALHERLVRISEGPDWIAGKDYVEMKNHASQLEHQVIELSAQMAVMAELLKDASKCMGHIATNGSMVGIYQNEINFAISNLPDQSRKLLAVVEAVKFIKKKHDHIHLGMPNELRCRCEICEAYRKLEENK